MASMQCGSCMQPMGYPEGTPVGAQVRCPSCGVVNLVPMQVVNIGFKVDPSGPPTYDVASNPGYNDGPAFAPAPAPSSAPGPGSFVTFSSTPAPAVNSYSSNPASTPSAVNPGYNHAPVPAPAITVSSVPSYNSVTDPRIQSSAHSYGSGPDSGIQLAELNIHTAPMAVDAPPSYPATDMSAGVVKKPQMESTSQNQKDKFTKSRSKLGKSYRDLLQDKNLYENNKDSKVLFKTFAAHRYKNAKPKDRPFSQALRDASGTLTVSEWGDPAEEEECDEECCACCCQVLARLLFSVVFMCFGFLFGLLFWLITGISLLFAMPFIGIGILFNRIFGIGIKVLFIVLGVLFFFPAAIIVFFVSMILFVVKPIMYTLGGGVGYGMTKMFDMGFRSIQYGLKGPWFLVASLFKAPAQPDDFMEFWWLKCAQIVAISFLGAIICVPWCFGMHLLRSGEFFVYACIEAGKEVCKFSRNTAPDPDKYDDNCCAFCCYMILCILHLIFMIWYSLLFMFMVIVAVFLFILSGFLIGMFVPLFGALYLDSPFTEGRKASSWFHFHNWIPRVFDIIFVSWCILMITRCYPLHSEEFSGVAYTAVAIFTYLLYGVSICCPDAGCSCDCDCNCDCNCDCDGGCDCDC